MHHRTCEMQIISVAWNDLSPTLVYNSTAYRYKKVPLTTQMRRISFNWLLSLTIKCGAYKKYVGSLKIRQGKKKNKRKESLLTYTNIACNKTTLKANTTFFYIEICNRNYGNFFLYFNIFFKTKIDFYS